MKILKKIENRLKRIKNKKLVGIILIVVGIIGLFSPILQGVLFIGMGIALLKEHSKEKRK